MRHPDLEIIIATGLLAPWLAPREFRPAGRGEAQPRRLPPCTSVEERVAARRDERTFSRRGISPRPAGLRSSTSTPFKCKGSEPRQRIATRPRAPEGGTKVDGGWVREEGRRKRWALMVAAFLPPAFAFHGSDSLNHVSSGNSCRALAMNVSRPADVVNQKVTREPSSCHFEWGRLSRSMTRWAYMLRPPRQQRTA